MGQILSFKFEYRGEVLDFTTPQNAVQYFNHKGYGMWNWQISAEYEPMTFTPIALRTFNYFTDVWNENSSIIDNEFCLAE
jgi:hypothetical protein